MLSPNFTIQETIIFCYCRQNIVRMFTRVPLSLTWHIFLIIVDYFALLCLLLIWTSLETISDEVIL